jgi:hypothetical protein
MATPTASIGGQRSAIACLLDERWRRPLFSVGSRDYDWLDVFLAAMLRHEWLPFERRLIEGLACLAEAKASAVWPSNGRVAEAAARFRYARNLLTGAETLAWLEDGGVSVEAWNDFLAGDLLREDGAERLEARVARHGPSIAIANDAFTAEGVCSGHFDRLAKTLAGRAAVCPATPVGEPPPDDPSTITHVLTCHESWLSRLDTSDVIRRLCQLFSLEVHFERIVRAAITETALAAEVSRHRLEWTRIDLERVSFASIDAAREAACWIREDARTLADVAIASRRTVHDTRALLEDLEPEWRDAALAAAVDELIGPLAIGQRHEVAWVVAKAAPALNDALVRTRAERAVVDQLTSSSTLAHVRWADGVR